MRHRLCSLYSGKKKPALLRAYYLLIATGLDTGDPRHVKSRAMRHRLCSLYSGKKKARIAAGLLFGGRYWA
ncbi:hypothetical protein [Agarivorans gilvus]|uniref:hypothetical protein n=1 Tax=Agarivorans gilvus TaxID=680279 RepID=UPI0009F82C56|nr:hypothetical protein [Agarivorans gilvus]